MEMFSWVTVGIMMVVAGGSLFLGAGIGHYQGYRKGFEDGKHFQRMVHVARYGRE